MGNTFAKNNTNDTINWNSIKTDKMSDNNVSGGALSNDSRLLLDRLTLDLPKNFVETETLSEVDNIFSKYQHISKVKSENELSDTSPFISSEMYNLLMKPELDRNTTVAKQVGGKIEGDDSSTSETSSSSKSDSDSDSDVETATVSQKKTKQKKQNKQHKSKVTSTQQDSANELSYVSSSAHTNSGSERDNKYKKKYSKKPLMSESLVSTEASSAVSSPASSAVSSPASSAASEASSPASSEASSAKSESVVSSNENSVSTIPNLNSRLPRSSIATSDINMITED